MTEETLPYSPPDALALLQAPSAPMRDHRRVEAFTPAEW